jgi:hypothetical protein
MKADESADCAGRWGGRLPTGLCFYFFLGPRNRKMHLKKLGFRRGSGLSMLRSTQQVTAKSVLFEKNNNLFLVK